jgi:hypothetical protein
MAMTLVVALVVARVRAFVAAVAAVLAVAMAGFGKGLRAGAEQRCAEESREGGPPRPLGREQLGQRIEPLAIHRGSPQRGHERRSALLPNSQALA